MESNFQMHQRQVSNAISEETTNSELMGEIYQDSSSGVISSERRPM
jgi:hypothetical protein